MGSPKRKRMWSSSSSSKKPKRKSSSSSSRGVSSSSEKLFTDLSDHDDPSIIGLEGVALLCEKVGIDCESDIRSLVLLWKLGSKEKPGQITREEFLSGCSELQVNSYANLKKLIPSLDTGFMDREDFKEFYKVIYRIIDDTIIIRSIDVVDY